MTNQASEDELRAEILTEFKQVHKLAPADYTENCTNVVMSLIRTEKLKLLAEVRAGEKLSAYPLRETGSGVLEPVHEYAIPVSSLNKLEAEL